MRIKRRRSDALFSLYIRARDKWRCVVCGKQFSEGARGLANSHFHGRRKESVRFDPDNCDAMCFSDHLRFTENPLDFVAWKRAQLGEDKFAQLNFRSNRTKKRNDTEDVRHCQELLDSLDE